MFFESDSSDSDLDDAGLIFLAQLLKNDMKKRKYWVHPINRQRETRGEFHTLVKELEADEERFKVYFRMNKSQFEEIHSYIQNDIAKLNTTFRRSIGTRERLAVCLRFLATGNSFRSMAFNYRLGFSTVAIIVEEVCRAVWKNMSSIVMPKPSKAKWIEIAKNFEAYWNFPNCIGALDGKHISIKCPRNAGSTFYNYKQQHFIVLLALVDAEYKFVMIDVGAYGRNSDGGILKKSIMGQMFEAQALDIPEGRHLSNNVEKLPYVIVADAAFPLKTYIMKPYSKPNLVNNDANKIFNYRLSRARRVVENAFGILSARWRVFQGPLQVQPKMADLIVCASCCLHNFLGTHFNDVGNNASGSNGNSGVSGGLSSIGSLARNPTSEALYFREKYKEYFNSPEGQVPWQWNSIG